jgi:hypothetical protein
MSKLTTKVALVKPDLLIDPATHNANLDAIDAAIHGGVVLAADGAIAISFGTVIITKGSIAAITIAAPVATTDDFKTLRIVTTTAFAHVVTSGTVGFNAKGSSGTATFAAAKGNAVHLVAYQGNWYASSTLGVTVA